MIQLFKPFLTYFWVWLFFAFLTGGIEGAAVTNTNFKIASDFAMRGESDEVRSFAMSFGGMFQPCRVQCRFANSLFTALGNFAGDVVGGALAIAIQVLSEKYLPVRS